MLAPLPTPSAAEVGSLHELAARAAQLIDFHAIPASMVYFYAVEGGYRATVHCEDVPAMCKALGVELAWKYAPNGKRRYVSVIIEGIEFSGSEECK